MTWSRRGFAVASLLIFTSPLIAQTVYFNDFEDERVGPEWSLAPVGGSARPPLRIAVAPADGDRFLGTFGNQVATLTIADLPPHSRIRVSFDLYVIGSWDGTGNREAGNTGGPDVWRFALTDGPTLVRTTFSNVHYAGWEQSFPADLPRGGRPAQSGAIRRGTLGFDADATYHMAFAFNHAGRYVSFSFSAGNLTGPADECWGLDNVEVIVSSDPGAAGVRQSDGSGLLASQYGSEAGIGTWPDPWLDIGAGQSPEFPFSSNPRPRAPYAWQNPGTSGRFDGPPLVRPDEPPAPSPVPAPDDPAAPADPVVPEPSTVTALGVGIWLCLRVRPRPRYAGRLMRPAGATSSGRPGSLRS